LLVEGSEEDIVALVVRGDHDLNATKAQRLAGVANPLRMAGAERIARATGAEPGFIGPVRLPCRAYAAHSALAVPYFVCGANERDRHLTGVNWDGDVGAVTAPDIRNAREGDPSP